jgi:diaminopimelate decarboxylase
MIERLSLFPVTAAVNDNDHLMVGGVDCLDLAARYGTPLYVYDEATLRAACREYRQAFGDLYPDTRVIYAGKAFSCGTLMRLVADEGLGLDVISGGELAVAELAAFPPELIYMHGNNKAAAELEAGLRYGVGRVVVDNFYELELLNSIAERLNVRQDILLRVSPGVDPHTHRFITTGNVDSKFGFPLGMLGEAVKRAQGFANLNLLGLHFHIGSQLHEAEPYLEAIAVTLKFAADMKAENGFTLEELDLGGGFGIAYTLAEKAPGADYFAREIAGAVKANCAKFGLELPRLVIEPGRAIVGRAGLALYAVGSAKDIPGVRRYVSVDGGMTDNIRPALYEAEYEAVAAGKMRADGAGKVTLAGKYCESGDILIHDIELPELAAGDILAVADTGAYCLAMGSNYNGALKPAVVMVADGAARLIRRRETAEDLLSCDMFGKKEA